MNTYRWNARAAVAMTAAAVVAGMAPHGAMAASDAPTPVPAVHSARQALAAEGKQNPGGLVVGNKVYHPDGTVFVAADSSAFTLSQCTSNKFCLWSMAYYQGSFR